MVEPGILGLAPPPNRRGFDAPQTLASDQAHRFARALASASWILLQGLAKVLGIACVLALLLPALLIASAVSLVVARVLGVPILSAPPPPFRLR